MAKKQRKPQPIAPDSRSYRRLAIELALETLQLHPCADCGGPVIPGRCCGRCESNNP